VIVTSLFGAASVVIFARENRFRKPPRRHSNMWRSVATILGNFFEKHFAVIFDALAVVFYM